jgi:flagellar basal body P-ring protein FlgI
MHVELTTRQKEYVEQYQYILNRLNQIQKELSSLGQESTDLIKNLQELREAESIEFPNANLIETLKEADE